MSNKSTFRKTLLALVIAGLALSMSVQSDSPFNFGRWGGGGGHTDPGSYFRYGNYNLDDIVIGQEALKSLLTSTEGEETGLNLVMYAGAEGGGFNGEGGEVNTGKGTMNLIGDVGAEGSVGTVSFSLNPEDFGGEGSGDYTGPAEFGNGESAFETGNEDGGAIGFALTESATSFTGFWGLDGLTDFGFFFAGEPVSSADLATLTADNIIGVYEGFSGFDEFLFEMFVNFSNATWTGTWEEGQGAIGEFTASGNVVGADFNATFANIEVDSTTAHVGSFVEGTFFGPRAETLGGHFEVSVPNSPRGAGQTFDVTADVFAATLEELVK